MDPVHQSVLVAGIGNIFLGDDGFGPEVVRHLAAPGGSALPEGVRPVDYGIRGMHLVYDLLEGYSALVIVDAVPGHGAPGEVVVLEISPADLATLRGEFDPHGMNPVAVLAGLPALGGELPPTYVVGAAPESLEDGIGLSPTMSAAVAPAGVAVRSCSRPDRGPSPLRPGRTDAMCLGIPGRVVELVDGYAGQLAMVDVQGATRRINLGMLDPEDQQVGSGDWVLIHMGFAVERIDAGEGRTGPGRPADDGLGSAMTLTVDRGIGPVLFARYAFPPNQLGYCGPDDAAGFLAHGVNGDDHGLRRDGAGLRWRVAATCN